MSTLVMVEKDGFACMAADTLSSYGCRKERAKYVANPEKILQVGESYVGVVGWAAHQSVLESALDGAIELPEFRGAREVFEFSRRLHGVLKEEYFLNAKADSDAPYESTQMSLFFANRFGLFALYRMRSVERYQRFAAMGSGTEYALGAMYASYELDRPAEDIARLGVEAGTEFDDGSAAPITLRKLALESKLEAVTA